MDFPGAQTPRRIDAVFHYPTSWHSQTHKDYKSSYNLSTTQCPRNTLCQAPRARTRSPGGSAFLEREPTALPRDPASTPCSSTALVNGLRLGHPCFRPAPI